MKRLLITGTGSFVGTAVQAHLGKWPDRYAVDVVDMQTPDWRQKDFSPYDAVFHVAGLAHADVGHVSEERKALYYKVNSDLPAETAAKAKAEGVKQFIFMSSAIIYGDSAPIGVPKTIARDTPPAPANFYGDSKLQAELKLRPLSSGDFKVAILRCPMIYGKGSKGNFPVLEKMAMKLPFFPKVANARSMLYVGNLAEFVRILVDDGASGTFWPCNAELSNTSELVRLIARARGKKLSLVPGFSPLLKLLSRFSPYVDKAFGNLAYAPGLGDYPRNYRLFSLEQSIVEAEIP